MTDKESTNRFYDYANGSNSVGVFLAIIIAAIAMLYAGLLLVLHNDRLSYCLIWRILAFILIMSAIRKALLFMLYFGDVGQ